MLDEFEELAAKIELDTSFKVLNGYIGDKLLNSLNKMGFTEMTDIQAKSIPHLLNLKFYFILITKNNFFC